MTFRITLSMLLLSFASLASAMPIVWDVNGHTYDIFTAPDDGRMTWEQAGTAAEALGGHLVTITSGDENDFVARLVADQGVGNRERYWLGGYQTDPGSDACEPASCWAWVTGETWGYDNWAPNEPNNGVGGTQHWLHYWPELGLFDDMENRNVMDSYVIEYSVPVPEPGTLLLLGAGLLGIGGRRRMKAKT